MTRKLLKLTSLLLSVSFLVACNEDNKAEETKKRVQSDLELYEGKFVPPTSPTPSPTATPTPTPIPVPVAPVINPLPTFINTPTFNVSGTGTQGTTLNLILGGSVIATNNITNSSNWLVAVGPLSDGTKLFTAAARFPGGEISAPSAEVTTTVDTVVPAAPVVTGPTLPSATGRPEITGTSEASTTVNVFFNGTESGAATSAGATAWIYTPGTALADGTYAVTARATDQAGNVSPFSASFNVVVDKTAPVAPVITGPTGGVTSDPTPQITGTAEPNLLVRLFVDGEQDGTTVAGATGNWALVVTEALANGTYTFTAQSVDGAGNVGPLSAGFDLTVDIDAPAAPVISGPTEPATTTRRPMMTGTAEPNIDLVVFLDGASAGVTGANGTGNWAFEAWPEPLSNGEYEVTVQASDAEGNLSPMSAPFTLTVNVAD